MGMKTNMTKLHDRGATHRPYNGRLTHLEAPTRDGDKLQRHADSAHAGVVDTKCPACREIQERYGVPAK